MFVVGALLCAAASLKFYGLTYSPIPQSGMLSTPPVQFAAIVWELALGALLISGLGRAIAWLLATLTFTAFAMISGYLGRIGQATSGCFGQIDASPWATFAIDVVVLSLLMVVRPVAIPLPNGPAKRRFRLGSAVVAFAVVLVFGMLIHFQDQAWAARLARLRGEALVIPAYVDLGEMDRGQVVERMIEITNASDRSIRIVGGTSDCSCFATNDLPMDLAPGETVRCASPCARRTDPGFSVARPS